MLTVEKLTRCVTEARRFIDKAIEARTRLKIDITAQSGCRETGACKRASMDLSKLLIELRK